MDGSLQMLSAGSWCGDDDGVASWVMGLMSFSFLFHMLSASLFKDDDPAQASTALDKREHSGAF